MIRISAWLLAIAVAVLIASASIPAGDDPATDLKDLHPKLFEMVLCQLSDTEQPVVTEFNLDAVRKNRNQFDFQAIQSTSEWKQVPGSGGIGFQRFRLLQSEGGHHTIEYQTNSGGTLTSSAVIGFSIASRTIQVEGVPVNTRVLRITSVSRK